MGNIYERMIIAYVEDDEIDAELMKRILTDMSFTGIYHHFSSAQKLMEWLSQAGDSGDYQDRLPRLLFSDIGLPGTSGKQILAQIRSIDRLKAIPVVMMSGSNSQEERDECIGLGSNGYLVKTGDFKTFSKLVQLNIELWSWVAQQTTISFTTS